MRTLVVDDPNTRAGQVAASDARRSPSRERRRRSERARLDGSAGFAGSTIPGTASGTLASRLLVFTICTALALSTLAYGGVHSWALAIFQAGAAIIVLLWVADAMQSGVLRVNRSLIQVPLIGLICIAAIQLLPLRLGGGDAARGAISYDFHVTLLTAIKALALFVYFAAALAFIDSPERLGKVARFVTVFGFLVAILGLVQAFVSPNAIYGIREPIQAVPFGPFINRHHFAAFMELSLALPLGLLFTGAIESDRRVLYGFAALMMAIALVMTGSRGAMLSLLAQIVFVVIVSARAREHKDSSARAVGVEGSRVGGKSRRSRRSEGSSRSGFRFGTGWVKRAGAVVAMLVALLMSVLMFGGEDALLRLVDSVNSADPTSGRTHIWATTLGIIRDHPILGVGLGAYSLAYTGYDTQGGTMRLEQAHNDYLQILADTGIVGGALGVLFLVILFRRAWRTIHSADRFRRGVGLGAFAGCIAELVHSFFEFALHTTANALLFLIIVALATLGSQVEQPHTSNRRSHPRRKSESSSDTGDAAPIVADSMASHEVAASS